MLQHIGDFGLNFLNLTPLIQNPGSATATTTTATDCLLTCYLNRWCDVCNHYNCLSCERRVSSSLRLVSLYLGYLIVYREIKMAVLTTTTTTREITKAIPAFLRSILHRRYVTNCTLIVAVIVDSKFLQLSQK